MWSNTFVDNRVMSQCEKIQVESQRILCLITVRRNHDRHSCLGRKSLHWLPLPPMHFQLLAWPIGQYFHIKDSSFSQSGSHLVLLQRTPKICPSAAPADRNDSQSNQVDMTSHHTPHHFCENSNCGLFVF